MDDVRLLLRANAVPLALLAALWPLGFVLERAINPYFLQIVIYIGINVNTIISVTFMLGSALAAAAGALVALRNPKIEPLMGLMPGIKAFVAAVLGGIGNFPGAVAGGLLMGVTETLVSAYLSSTYRDAVAFVILIAVLLVRPTGLFGSPATEKV